MSDETRLRLYINDPAGVGQFFDSPTLLEIISDFDNDLYAAASECWKIKAANVSTWYQVSLDGAFLSREQVWEHCIEMAKMYGSMGAGSSGSLASVRLASDNASTDPESEFD